VLALLMSPLFYALLIVGLDLVNLAVPTPDLWTTALAAIEQLVDTPEAVPLGRWIYVSLMAALPGLLVMALVMLVLHRIVREAESGGAQMLGARAPDPGSLAEQRFANVVAEMALAAAIPAPRVLVVPSEAANAAAYGEKEQGVTVVMSTGLLGMLDRAQMQGAAGHLVGLIANGDVPQGMRVAQTLSLFGFAARLSDAIVDAQALRRLVRLARSAFRRGGSSADAELILELTNPFASSTQRSSRTGSELTWKDWLSMPLFGPLVMGGFFSGLASTVLLQPLLALAWRRRKYMADAIALQLTRDPDALAGALQALATAPTAGAVPAWAAHMALAEARLKGGMLGSQISLFPSLARRLKALGVMGAHVTLRVPRLPTWIWLMGAPVAALIAVLLAIAMYLLILVSIALSLIFTGLPTAILHFILR
jgi:Zn-dependent protease with chaperone function